MTESKNPYVSEHEKNSGDSAKSLDQTIDSGDSRSQIVRTDNQENDFNFQRKVRIMPKITEESTNQSAIDSESPEQNEHANFSEDSMENIAQKLEEDLLSELQSALEKPLVIPNEGASSGNGSPHSDSRIDNEPEDVQSMDSDIESQPNKEEVSIRILQESRNSARAQSGQNPEISQDSNPISGPAEETDMSEQITHNSEPNPEASKNRFELSDTGASLPDAEENIEMQNQDDSPETTQLEENSLGVSSESYQRHTNQGIDTNEVKPNMDESNDSNEDQMSLPGIQEIKTSTNEDSKFHVPGVQNPIKRQEDSQLRASTAESASVEQKTTAKRGFSVSFIGFLLLLIGGGALFAYSTFTSEPESSAPLLIAADKSPMKIFPERDGTDDVQSANGKIVFDRVEGIDSDSNGRLVVPQQVEIADLSELAENNESSNSTPPQTRTVVVRPDGTVIEGGLAGKASNQDSNSEIDKVEQDEIENSSAGNSVDNSGESTGQQSGSSNNSVAQQSDNLETEEENNDSIIAQVENLLGSSDDSTASADSQASTEDSTVSVDNQASSDDSTVSADSQASTDDSIASEDNQVSTDNSTAITDSQTSTEIPAPPADSQASTENSASENVQAQQESETIGSISGTEVSDAADGAETGEVLSEPTIQFLPKPKPDNLLVAANSAPSDIPVSEETTSNTSDDSTFPLTKLEPGTPVAQILADKNIETARNGYESIRRRHSDLLQNYSPVVQIGETDTGTWYRVQIEMNSFDDALRLCRQLRQQGQDCVPKNVVE